MRKSNAGLLGKYSDGSYKRKGKKDAPAIVEYKQLYKGEIKAKTVTEKKFMTLEDKIKARSRQEKKKRIPKNRAPRSRSAVYSILSEAMMQDTTGSKRSANLLMRSITRQKRTTLILQRIRLLSCHFSRHAISLYH